MPPGSLWGVARGEFGETDDGGEDIVEVVGDASGEGAEGLHLLGLAKLGFELLPLCDV